MNSVRAERLLVELDAEVHINTLDPSSYTAYADAATCAATAAPTPVNELAVPQPQIIEKSVEFPATLFDVTSALVTEHLLDDT